MRLRMLLQHRHSCKEYQLKNESGHELDHFPLLSLKTQLRQLKLVKTS